jgi:hypothetical protein
MDGFVMVKWNRQIKRYFIGCVNSTVLDNNIELV